MYWLSRILALILYLPSLTILLRILKTSLTAMVYVRLGYSTTLSTSIRVLLIRSVLISWRIPFKMWLSSRVSLSWYHLDSALSPSYLLTGSAKREMITLITAIRRAKSMEIKSHRSNLQSHFQYTTIPLKDLTNQWTRPYIQTQLICPT